MVTVWRRSSRVTLGDSHDGQRRADPSPATVPAAENQDRARRGCTRRWRAHFFLLARPGGFLRDFGFDDGRPLFQGFGFVGRGDGFRAESWVTWLWGGPRSRGILWGRRSPRADGTAVRGADGMDDGKTEARSADLARADFVRAIKALEQMRQGCARDPRAGIDDFQERRAILGPDGQRYFPMFGLYLIALSSRFTT